jgi:hypothetical protein
MPYGTDNPPRTGTPTAGHEIFKQKWALALDG